MDNKSLKPGDSTLQGGKYIITRVLGQGGFGITYEAEQVSLGRKVAVKEFFMKEYCERDGSTSRVSVPSSGSRELVGRFRQKFLREARMIASLNHPNIVKIYDVFEENDTAYYVMEHLPGGSLSDMVGNDGALPEDKCIAYIRQVASALDYLHRRKTLHFDVKPSNILFDEDGRAVLIDFGISKHYDTGGHQTSSTPVGLSKGYAPLEQYRQDDVSTFTPATDIYSLGATLYYTATGTTPPDASIVYDEGLERPSGISDRLWTAIEHAMQPRRKDRPQSIKEFLSLLDGANTGSGIAADNKKNNTDDATVVVTDKATDDDTTHIENTPPPASTPTSKPKADSRQESNPISASGPKAGSKPKQATNPEQEPSKESKKGFPKWLYAVIAAIVVGLIVLFAIPKSKPTLTPNPTTTLTPEPVKEEVVTPASTPNPTTTSTTTTTATTSSGNTGTGKETGHEYVDLGLSVKWATCNIGASKPEGYGDYYAWGEISTKNDYSWSTYKYCNGSYDKLTKYCNDSGYGNNGFTDGKTKLELSDDVARQKWGGSWRMPTRAEQDELRNTNNCTWTWTTQNGVKGYLVTSKKSGHEGASIFLPAAGYRDGAGLDDAGSYGDFWSSSLNTDTPGRAYCLYFNSGEVDWNGSNRYYGQSVRPVCQ